MSKKTVNDYEFMIVELANRRELFVTPDIGLDDIDTKTALELSVKKWETLLANIGDGLDIITRGPKTCALCVLYWLPELCVGCPVEQASGDSCCCGTPHYVLEDGRLGREFVENELDFLIALRDGGVEAGKKWLEQWRERMDERGISYGS